MPTELTLVQRRELTQQHATRYLDEDAGVIAWNNTGKGPKVLNWVNNARFTYEQIKTFTGHTKIGAVLGPEANGVCDIDLDCDIARRLAPFFLPKTPIKSGRATSYQSHWWYKISADDFDDVRYDIVRDPITKETLLEFRWGTADKPHQTVIPPSLHEASNEITEWNLDDSDMHHSSAPFSGMPVVKASELIRRFNLLAAATLIARHWPGEGSRQDTMLALAGGLAKSDWTLDQTIQFMRCLFAVLGEGRDPSELERRISGIRNTYNRYEKDGKKSISGFATLTDFIKVEVVERFCDQLNIKWRKGLVGYAATDIKAQEIREKHELDDFGNIERFIHAYEHTLRYVPDIKSWFVFNGQRWRLDNVNIVNGLAHNLHKLIRDEAEQRATSQRERDEYISLSLKSRGHLKMEQFTRALNKLPELSTTIDMFDANIHLLNVLNGTLNLRAPLEDGTFELRPFDAGDLITLQADVLYDPLATCPRWLRFIELICLGDKETIRLFQQMCGYALTGSTAARKWFILYGLGANGKTTLETTLALILGGYAVRINTETLVAKPTHHADQPRDDVVRLRGRRYAYGSEFAEGKQLDTPLIKDITGGDAITFRTLYARAITFTPQCKIWLGANHKPIIRDDTNSIWDRMVGIPMDYRFPENERRPLEIVIAEFMQEASGILNWALEGLKQLMINGWQFDLGSRQVAFIEQYRKDSDMFGAFISENLIVDPNDKQCFEGTDLIYQAYSIHAKDNNEYPMTSTRFTQKLKERYPWLTQRNSTRYDRTLKRSLSIKVWQGIKQKTAMEARNETTEARNETIESDADAGKCDESPPSC